MQVLRESSRDTCLLQFGIESRIDSQRLAVREAAIALFGVPIVDLGDLAHQVGIGGASGQNQVTFAWIAEIRQYGKRKYLGAFPTPEKARDRYLQAVSERC